MKLSKTTIDTSHEFHVYRYRDGLKLLKPDVDRKQNLSIGYTGFTIAEMMRLPFGVYFYNSQSMFQCINNKHAESCGFDSESNAIGKTVLDTSIAKYADNLFKNNRDILLIGKMKILEEEIMHNNGTYNHGISIKIPLYERDSIVGIVGCTIVTGKHDLADSLSKIAQLNLLNTKTSLFNNYTSLTQRETEILYHLVRGQTAKHIGALLHISHRTVEQHIEKIKLKLNVFSKSELIEKVLDGLI